MTAAYSTTRVPVAKSQEEVRNLLRKAGAGSFTMGEGIDPATGVPWAGVEFIHGDVLVRLRAQLRPATDDVIAEHARSTKTKRLSPDAFERLEADRVWRVLVWTIKARIVAVDEGLETFEQHAAGRKPGQRVLHRQAMEMFAGLREKRPLPITDLAQQVGAPFDQLQGVIDDERERAGERKNLDVAEHHGLL